jgi:hypothetical protein
MEKDIEIKLSYQELHFIKDNIQDIPKNIVDLILEKIEKEIELYHKSNS